MSKPKRRGPAALMGAVALGTVISLTGAGLAAGSSSSPQPGHLHGYAARQHTLNTYLRTHRSARESAADTSNSVNSTPDDNDLADQNAQYDFERTAPAAAVNGPALASAEQAASALPATGGQWQLTTDKPYNAEPSNYTDPFWGNEGAGFSLVSGRVTALVSARDGAWFLGAADGGVWRSWDQGQHWTPVFDNMPTLSIGALAIDPADGSLWVGTGEANVSQDAYAGTGVYRSFDNGRTWHLVGAVNGFSPMASDSVFRIAFDHRGNAYAATDNGLFRYSARSRQWTEVLDPAGPTDNPPYDQQVTDVAIVPGSHGRDVIAAIGWHGPGNQENNGFYESTDSGHHFSEVTVSGDINASDIGRTTFAYSRDGTKLYAIVQSPSMLAANDESVLQGIFVSTGSPASVAGPWKLIGNEASLAASGSALAVGSGYGVGVQAWYNQDLAVDPNNPNHVYAGLEEVFESTNGGQSWITASPYWNYPFACDATNTCPNTTHPDQHAMMITDGKIVIGNDGGVYSRPLSDDAEDGQWTDLNATLRTMQYYDARAGSLPGGGTQVWGGMQDNGSAVVSTSSSQVSEAAGGDGFDVVVDPKNGNNIVGEYTDGTMYSSTDGGHSFFDPVSPTCVGQAEVGVTPRSDCDPNARFVTPLIQDQQNPDVWVTGGEFVWVTTSGWNTSCTDTACSWTPVYDTGSGNAVTALSSADNGSIIYAAWVGGGGNPGPTFASGIATNYGGTWHEVSTAGLPDRYIAGVTVDPSNPAHAYAIFNGYSRRWVPGGGVGHVFETWNGGQSWTDISGNLPDIASDALVLMHHRLALATDGGAFTAREGEGSSTRWSRLGHGLPNAAIDDLTVGPNGYIYAATHGRGVWRVRF
jgi:sugar lactone lactonase YvrE